MGRLTGSLQLLLLSATFASFTAARHVVPGLQIDPLTDPKDDPFNPLHYIANNGLTAMAVGESSIRYRISSVLGKSARQRGVFDDPQVVICPGAYCRKLQKDPDLGKTDFILGAAPRHPLVLQLLQRILEYDRDIYSLLTCYTQPSCLQLLSHRRYLHGE